jgi:hypothetical protein
MTPSRTTLLLAAALTSGCAYTEDSLEHFDLYGKVRIPKEATAITVTVSETDEEGNTVSQDVDLESDVRNIGPVYLGVYPGVDTNLFEFPHPEIGPVLSEDTLDSYPYGGSTVGRPGFACYELLVCKVTTGRFTSYDDILEFFRDDLQNPVLNQYGEEVTSETEFREWCYETMFLTSDTELPFLAMDGVDFVDKGDYWEADATIYHSYFREGATVWGWMDAPTRSYNFASCSDSNAQGGWQQFYYTEQYVTGATFAGLLNAPANYIDRGDWISETGDIMQSPDDNFVVELGYKYE